MNKQYHCKAERNVPDVIYAQFCIDCCKIPGIQKKDKRSCKCEYDGGQDTPVYLLPKLILPDSSFTQSFRSKFVLVLYIIIVMKDAGSYKISNDDYREEHDKIDRKRTYRIYWI